MPVMSLVTPGPAVTSATPRPPVSSACACATFQQMIDLGFETKNESMSDHPSLSSRVAAARQRAARLPPEAQSLRRPAVAQGAAFRALQDRTVELAASLPRDQTLEAAAVLLAAVPSCMLPEDQPQQKAAQAKLRAAVAAAKQP